MPNVTPNVSWWNTVALGPIALGLALANANALSGGIWGDNNEVYYFLVQRGRRAELS